MLKQKLKRQINKVYLGLGSNVGNKLQNIKDAVKLVNKDNQCEVSNFSSVYETTPFGNIKDQENFLNCVIEILTSMDPVKLLEFIKDIEAKIGRKQRIKWGPREIDIDILLFNQEIISDSDISIPHNEILNRDFVLIPLIEVDEKLLYPVSKKLFSYYLNTNRENHILGKRKIDLLN